MNNSISTRVALVGGGPACCTAAIQLTRAGIECLLISDEIGGKIRNANLIENLLGFPNGISGEEFVKLVKKQLRQLDVQYVTRKAEKIEYNEKRFVINTSKEEIISEYLIVGTGSIPKKLHLEGEEELFSKNKLFYENYNARNHVKGKNVVIIGSGDVAYDYALNLSDSAENISIIQRSKISKSIPVLQVRVRKQENISVLVGITLNKMKLEGKKIIINAKKNDKSIPIFAEFVIVAIGREPDLNILSKDLLNSYEEKTELPFLHFIGDVKRRNYRQVSIAMGDGMDTAMEIVKKITAEEGYHGTSGEIW